MGRRAPRRAPSPPTSAPQRTKCRHETRQFGRCGGAFAMGTSDHPWAYDNERPAHDGDAGAVRDGRHTRDRGRLPRPSSTTAAISTTGCGIPTDGRSRNKNISSTRSSGSARAGRLVAAEVRADERTARACRRARTTRQLVRGRRLRPVGRQAAAHRARMGVRRPRRRHGARPTSVRRPTVPAAVGRGLTTPDGVSRPVRRRVGVDELGLQPYPGFESFPYDEYSKVFFGPEYKVLRGGSWATDPVAMRRTFRNWDYPIRRQIFAGFRCAQDA